VLYCKFMILNLLFCKQLNARSHPRLQAWRLTYVIICSLVRTSHPLESGDRWVQSSGGLKMSNGKCKNVMSVHFICHEWNGQVTKCWSWGWSIEIQRPSTELWHGLKECNLLIFSTLCWRKMNLLLRFKTRIPLALKDHVSQLDHMANKFVDQEHSR
jgi:hypothetical protein